MTIYLYYDNIGILSIINKNMNKTKELKSLIENTISEKHLNVPNDKKVRELVNSLIDLHILQYPDIESAILELWDYQLDSANYHLYK